MTDFKRTLITSALPYANGPVHIGHLAGVYVPADIYARFLRMNGQEVAFIGGSGEHGFYDHTLLGRWGPLGKQLVGQTGQSVGKHVGGAGPQP